MMNRELLPTQWQDWRIVGEIGEGAYGAVYRAEKDTGGVRAVSAIKVVEIPAENAELGALKKELRSDQSLRSYLKDLVDEYANEIRAMYQLQGDSNIVSIQDHAIVNSEDGLKWKIFIRMECLQGFDDFALTKQFTQRDIIDLGISLCVALSKCARLGIIHRDIKPENIFVTASGNYKLGDFGVARIMDGIQTTYSQKGTLSYMAPEVFAGQKYGPSVDLYSLGLLLYRLCNHNREPFVDLDKQIVYHRDREAALARRMGGEALPPPADASPALAKVILKACAFDPAKRYAGADEMRAALEALLPENRPPAPEEGRTGLAGLLGQSARRRKTVRAALAAGAGLVLAIIVLSSILSPRSIGPADLPAANSTVSAAPSPTPDIPSRDVSFCGLQLPLPEAFFTSEEQTDDQHVFYAVRSGQRVAFINLYVRQADFPSGEFAWQRQGIVADRCASWGAALSGEPKDIEIAGLPGQRFTADRDSPNGIPLHLELAYCLDADNGRLIFITLVKSEKAAADYPGAMDHILGGAERARQ